jgi:hypothetical protein
MRGRTPHINNGSGAHRYQDEALALNHARRTNQLYEFDRVSQLDVECRDLFGAPSLVTIHPFVRPAVVPFTHSVYALFPPSVYVPFPFPPSVYVPFP